MRSKSTTGKNFTTSKTQMTVPSVGT